MEILFHSIGVANGTDAIALCLKVLGFGNGDEVITASHTAVATVAGIEQAGCTPVFADIELNSRCIDPESVKKRITNKTKAIMPVHIYGKVANMKKIMGIAESNDLQVVEDCSQAHGAEVDNQKVGTFSCLSAFSCYPTKNLGGTGDGGVILCKNQELYDKLKSLRQYGWNEKRESVEIGINSRLDELQAAILRIKLKHLPEGNEKRRNIAERYNQSFKKLPIIVPTFPTNELHAMHLYVIECERRDELLDYLLKNQIGASLHYPLAVHQQSAYRNRIKGMNDLPNTNLFYKRNLTLPIYPELSNEKIEYIIKKVTDWFKF